MAWHVPTDALLTTPFFLRVTALPAGAAVTVQAETHDRHGESWRSRATFQTTAQGELDVASQGPLDGSYRGVDAGGVLWSMRPRADLTPAFFETPDAGYEVRLSVTLDGRPLTGTGVLRRARLPELQVQPVREDGLYGTLYTPPATLALRGAALLLGGSEGGLLETRAALLASEGFMVLNLAYFGAPGLPESLINIPLEYFERGIRVLQAQPQVRGRRVGVGGASKGAEAALLLGATFPQRIGAVAASASGGVVFEGIDRAGTHPPDRPMSSWSLNGRALAYLPYRTDWGAHFSQPGSVRMTPVHEKALREATPEQLRAAVIPAERIRGPVLLVTGGDDGVWNAHELSVIAQRRRERAGLAVQHLTHPDAGHALGLPGFPTYIRTPWTALGGQPQADAHLQRRAWEATVATLAHVWQEP